MGQVVILGVFVADTAYRAARQPVMGETILGNSFALGPGGKGSNQAVAAARAGATTHFISKLGADAFGDMALKAWREAGVIAAVEQVADNYTGAAYVFIEEATGNNAIIISPGAAATISAEDVAAHHALIAGADIFITQLEQPMEAAHEALRIAHAGTPVTILNPAPAADLPKGMLALCDYVTPNETEAEGITGIKVATLNDARRAAEDILGQGAGAVIVTLGENGALYHTSTTSTHIPAMSAGPVAETTGAGDAFHGGFATGLSEGRTPIEAVRMGCATAAISVTRPGTAASMPNRAEIDALLAQNT